MEAATRIGLIPAISGGRIVQVGNAAIEGATIALLSRAKRQELEELVRSSGALPSGNPSAILRFLRGWLPVPPVESVRQVAG